jgi:hypothetical protein
MDNEEQQEKQVIYQFDTTSIMSVVNDFNVCFSWQQPLEEISEKKVMPGLSVQALERGNIFEVIWPREEDVSTVSEEPSEEELLDSWDRYLAEHWDELAAQYKGKYVAIWNNSVYDSDKDLTALAERVYAALGYRPIFMPYIGDKEQVYEFTSPA